MGHGRRNLARLPQDVPDPAQVAHLLHLGVEAREEARHDWKHVTATHPGVSSARIGTIWDTPGCSAQAGGIRDDWQEFEKRGAIVLGVSPDSPASHVKFKEKYGLPFTLLSDEQHEAADRYGTWVEKRMYGKTYMGMERSTFVIDAEGTVVKVMRKVKPDTHAADVLSALP